MIIRRSFGDPFDELPSIPTAKFPMKGQERDRRAIGEEPMSASYSSLASDRDLIRKDTFGISFESEWCIEDLFTLII